MKNDLLRNWPGLVLTLLAVVICYLEYQAVPITKRFSASAIENPFFVAAGKWGIRFLLLSLAITPLYAFTGWRFPIRLRKPAGLLAFGFVALHVGIHLFSVKKGMLLHWFSQPDFVRYGTAAFIILLLMAITSVRPAMRLLGRWWKRLHRLVYAAGLLAVLHALLAASTGKRPVMGGEASAAELRIYLYVLITLLLLRVPLIRDWLKATLPFAPNPRKSKRRRAPGDALV